MAILKIVACGQEIVQDITAHKPQILVLILPFFVQIKQTKYHIVEYVRIVVYKIQNILKSLTECEETIVLMLSLKFRY